MQAIKEVRIVNEKNYDGIHIWGSDGSIHLDERKWDIERDRNTGTVHIHPKRII